MRRARILVALIGTAALTMAAISPASADSAASYTVTITNLTDGQPFTPPLVASHRPSVDLYEVGEPASEAIMQIAENGNLGPAVEFATESEASKHIVDAVVALPSDGPPPILPGESRSFTLTASNCRRRSATRSRSRPTPMTQAPRSTRRTSPTSFLPVRASPAWPMTWGRPEPA